jgi:uncharacterized membrane protein/mono/diheme cytochrome c family protein
MQRFKTIVFNITFALNCGLLFLLLFEQRLHIPAWLQVAGRMHPLALHFPIVLLVLAVAWEAANFFKTSYPGQAQSTGNALLLSAALTSVFTALMGLFLSREEGYEPNNLLWHKWGGVIVSLLALLWYAFRNAVRRAKTATVATALVALGAVIITGHQGANITHGENFLMAPMLAGQQKAPVLLEDAEVYAHMVQPILESKCNNCHNEGKRKGSLSMETAAALLKGGKNGALWDSTEKDLGLLLRRIHLPEENKKHMPPKGKPQLTEEEIQILYHWIKRGASLTTKVTELPPEDTLHLLATARFQTIETDSYTFEPADKKKVASLNTAYRVVAPLAVGSPALGVAFFGASQFQPKQLEELQAVKEQIVSLNLAKMPAGDEDLKNMAMFANLRRLNLSFTQITGSGLKHLINLKELRQLSLSGTNIQADQLRVLAALPKLTHLYLWNTAVPPQELQSAAQYFKNVTIETGFKGDTVVLKLNAPVIENEEQIVVQAAPLKLKHYINGVAIRYTTDGTEPDSLASPLYKAGVLIDRTMTVKAKAFKPGWISSDVATKAFFRAGHKPDSVRLLQPPDPQYKGDGAATLYDGQKGEVYNRSGGWLGYRERPLQAFFYFTQPKTVSSVTVSTLVDIDGYIVPPQQIEVWGGASAAQLRLLGRSQPQQPVKDKPNYMQGYDVPFKPVQANVLKVVVKPVPKLPARHPGKGDKGWTFVDEIFVN